MSLQTLPLLCHRPLQPHQLDEVGLILGLVLLQRPSLLGQATFTALQLLLSFFERRLQFLLRGIERPLVLGKPLPFPLQFFAGGGIGRLAGCLLLLDGGDGLELSLELALALLQLARGPANRLVQSRQAIASLPVAVVKLL